MKKTFFALLLCSITQVMCAQSNQDCSVERFRRLMKEANDFAFGKTPDYQLAVNKLLSAKTCQPDSEAVVNRVLIKVFDEVSRQRTEAVRQKGIAQKQTAIAQEQSAVANSEREKAETEARRIYANDLAFKSTIALRDGDRTAAYRLAEFAYQYVDDDNIQVIIALTNALYHTNLPWSFDFDHDDPVTYVSMSRDGKRIATQAGTLAKVWDLESGKTILTLNGVYDTALSPDGIQLAIATSDTSKIWDLETGKVVTTLIGSYSIIAFSSDGKRLATRFEDKLDTFLDTDLGETLTIIPSNPKVKIWDLENGKSYVTSEMESDIISFSPDGKYLATGSEEFAAIIWDIENDTAKLKLEQDNEDGEISAIAFSPDGNYLAAGYSSVGNVTVKVWDLESGKSLRSFNNIWENFSSKPSFESPEQAEGFMMGEIENSVMSVAFSPDGKHLVTGTDYNTSVILDLEKGQKILTLIGHQNSISSVLFSSDGTRILTGSYDGKAKLWDLNNDKKILKITGVEDEITSVAFSPDGTRLATGSEDKSAKIWDLEKGEEVLSLVGHASGISSVAFSPDGTRLATGSYDKSAKIWDLENGNSLNTLVDANEFGENDVLRVSFAPDGSHLATTSNDLAVIWNLRTGKQEFSHHDSFNKIKVAYSPDGNRLAMASDKTIKIWDLKSNKVIDELSQNNYVLSVAFSPNGKFLATGSQGGVAKIWNLENGTVAIELGTHNAVREISFSPDGKRLATVSYGEVSQINMDDKVFEINGSKTQVWDLSPQQINFFGSKIGLAQMTVEQLKAYGLDNLLDQKKDNIGHLISSGDIRQISAFAYLYSQKNSQPGLTNQANHDRALLLYRACLSHNVDNAYFEKKIADLEQVWRKKTE